jgi:hypothetical protein
MKNIEVKGVEVFKNGVHVWNAGRIYDLTEWSNIFTREEAEYTALQIAKSNFFSNFKWSKDFDWGTICTDKKGNKNFFPKNLKFKFVVKDVNVFLYMQSNSFAANKSKEDAWGFTNHFTETKHRLGGEFKEVMFLGSLNDNVSFLD